MLRYLRRASDDCHLGRECFPRLASLSSTKPLHPDKALLSDLPRSSPRCTANSSSTSLAVHRHARGDHPDTQSWPRLSPRRVSERNPRFDQQCDVVHIIPCPPTELPILEAIIKCVRLSYFRCFLFTDALCIHSIRNRLTALKKNRGEYIKVSDVNALYQAIVKQGQCCTMSPQSHRTDHHASISSMSNIALCLCACCRSQSPVSTTSVTIIPPTTIG